MRKLRGWKVSRLIMSGFQEVTEPQNIPKEMFFGKFTKKGSIYVFIL